MCKKTILYLLFTRWCIRTRVSKSVYLLGGSTKNGTLLLGGVRIESWSKVSIRVV